MSFVDRHARECHLSKLGRIVVFRRQIDERATEPVNLEVPPFDERPHGALVQPAEDQIAIVATFAE